jgi:hypothetical protein
VATRYGKGLLGCATVLVILALLIHWIGIDTIARYRDDLGFYLQAHLVLVLASMAAALAVGIPAGIASVDRTGSTKPSASCSSSTLATPFPPWPFWPSP